MAKPLEEQFSLEELIRAETRLKVIIANKKIDSLISRTTNTPHDIIIHTIKCKVFGDSFVNSFNANNKVEITDSNNHEKFPDKKIFNYLDTDALEYYISCANEIISVCDKYNYSITKAIDYLTTETIEFQNNPFNKKNKPDYFHICNNDIENLSKRLKRRIEKEYPSVEEYFEDKYKKQPKQDIKLQEYAIEFAKEQQKYIYLHGIDVYTDEDKDQLRALGYQFKSDDDEEDLYNSYSN